MDNLEDEEDNAPTSVPEKTIPEEDESVKSSHTEDFEELDGSSSDTASDSDSVHWSDDEDDEAHALSRTASGRPIGNIGNNAATTKPAEKDNGADYFSRPVRVTDDNPTPSDDEKAALAALSSQKISELLDDGDIGDGNVAMMAEVSPQERPKFQRNQS